MLSRGWVPRWLGKLLETLHQRETSAGNLNEKQVFSQARTALVGYRDLLASRFIAEIAEVVQGSAAPQGNAGPARSLRSLSFDDLELMDHQQVQETVELARVQQIVKMAADEELVAFNARLCRAQGYDVVRIETNPLRPEAVVGALMKALSGLHVHVEVAEPLDRIAAVVNEDVVLQSELDRAVQNVVSQYASQPGQLPPRAVLERQVLERLVLVK